MRLPVIIMAMAALVTLISALSLPSESHKGVAVAITRIRLRAKIFAQSTADLQKAIQMLSPSNKLSVVRARRALQNSRYKYKSIEYFLEYFFKSSAYVYNSPPKYEIEEPEMEYQEPIGFQVIEGLLYQPLTPATKKQLLGEAEAINSSAHDIGSLLYDFEANDRQLLESVRLELIRVITLGITGYDAPLLKSGITESYGALLSLQSALAPFLDDRRPAKNVSALLAGAIVYLKNNPDFDSFNRLRFLTIYALPLQQQLNLLIKQQHLELNTTGILNYDAPNLFSKNFFKVDSFYKEGVKSNPQIIALGKRLFFEKAISGNGIRSCAGCHQPEKYFTDGLPKSTTLNGHSTIKRNAPTLLYAAYQYRQDWDGKARSLEDQVINVMNSKDEMNADTLQVIQKMMLNKTYLSQFKSAFPAAYQSVTIHNLSSAIAAYLRTLAPMNSAFDRYIRGEKKAITATQIKGFNLFMGKAQCGTCHFAPLFNGLTPPDYQVSEYETLGVPLTDDLQKPQQDSDSGRYTLFPIKYYNGAFKTPTVRNAAKTGPYMHNGSFHSLKKVLDFYNKGGGQGIGLNVPEQTLASADLKLSQREIDHIISFLNALTDHY